MLLNDPSVGKSRRLVLKGLAMMAVLPLLSKLGGTAFAQATSAADFVQSLGNETIAVLKGGGMSPAKVDKLVPILNRAVNMDLVSRLVAGIYWRQMTPAQQQQFVELFRELSIKTMADGLSSYTGQTFKVTGTRAADDRDTVVSTEIDQPDGGQPYEVDWRVRSLNGQYTIVEIVAEGVSMVVTQRNEIGGIAGSQGIDGMLAEMQRRVQSNQLLRSPT